MTAERFIDGAGRRLLRAAVLLFAALSAVLPIAQARAADAPSIVTGFEQSADNEGFRISIKVYGKPDTRLIVLANPSRIALDMMNTLAAVPAPEIAPGPLVSRLRDGLVAADRYRIVFELKQPGVPRLEAREDGNGTVLDLKIEAADAAAFRAAASKTTAGPAGSAGEGEGAGGEKKFTVVVDAGHGGIDLGAIGKGGTLEKELNLDFAGALRDVLLEQPDVEVVMTRDEDVFIPLAERSAIARRIGADLFISLHADSIRYPELRGATVYTLSDKASDALSSEIADSENASDRFAGPEWNQDAPEIHDILVDLVRRETEGFSQHLAATLVLQMKEHEIRLINNPKRSAGFRVLKAPDVPSVLLEIGYLSNKEDETLLVTEKWQRVAADAIASAIVEFIRSRSAIADMSGR